MQSVERFDKTIKLKEIFIMSEEKEKNFRAKDGTYHADAYEVERHEKLLGVPADSGGGFLGGVAGIGGNLLGQAVVFFVLFYIFYYAIRQYAFYVVPWIVLLIALKITLKPKILGIIAGIGVLSCLYGAFIYYPYVIEPSSFTHDNVVTEQTMHRFRGFGNSTELPIGERVTVNGISRDRTVFNITTQDGKTGWVSAEAFPEDAVNPVDDVWAIIKSNINPFNLSHRKRLQRENINPNWKRMHSRDWNNVEKKIAIEYFGQEWTKTEESGLYRSPSTGLTPKALTLAKGVGLSVPAKWQRRNDAAIEKLTGEKRSTVDVEVILLNVAYTPEATIIQLDVSEKDAVDNLETGLDATLTDLETGKVFPLFSYEFVRKSSGNEYFLIFAPTQSKHFALSQMSEKEIKKYGKKLAEKEIVLWNFPEVKVGDLPLQKPKATVLKPNLSATVTASSTTMYGEVMKTVFLIAKKAKMDEMATLKKGDAVIVTGQAIGDWTPVLFDAGTKELKGYVKTADISKERTVVKPVTFPYKVKVTGKCDLYPPSLEGRDCVVNKGEVLKITGQRDNTYYDVEYNGKKLIVNGRILKQNTEPLK